MYRTPLKNSKSVSKPFKSPFDSPAQNTNQSRSSDRKNKVNDKIVNSPLSARNLDAKRVLVLDEDEGKNKFKSVNLNVNQSSSNTPKKLTKSGQLEKKLKTVKSSADESPVSALKKITKNDLLALKKKTFEVRQELESIKSRAMCAKKNDPQELRDSIKRWRAACQNALETLRSEASERNGQSLKVSDVLTMLKIPETLVHYSEKDDSFA